MDPLEPTTSRHRRHSTRDSDESSANPIETVPPVILRARLRFPEALSPLTLYTFSFAACGSEVVLVTGAPLPQLGHSADTGEPDSPDRSSDQPENVYHLHRRCAQFPCAPTHRSAEPPQTPPRLPKFAIFPHKRPPTNQGRHIPAL